MSVNYIAVHVQNVYSRIYIGNHIPNEPGVVEGEQKVQSIKGKLHRRINSRELIVCNQNNNTNSLIRTVLGHRRLKLLICGFKTLLLDTNITLGS